MIAFMPCGFALPLIAVGEITLGIHAFFLLFHLTLLSLCHEMSASQIVAAPSFCNQNETQEEQT